MAASEDSVVATSQLCGIDCERGGGGLRGGFLPPPPPPLARDGGAPSSTKMSSSSGSAILRSGYSFGVWKPGPVAESAGDGN